jgi:hypothetical protein
VLVVGTSRGAKRFHFHLHYLPERARKSLPHAKKEEIPMPETPVKTNAAVDKTLTEALRAGGVPKEALATAVGFVRELSAKGLKPTRGFPNGVPPIFDLVSIETQVGANQLASVLPFLTRPGVRGLKILINGIPDPDIYRLQFDLNVPR